MVSVQALLRGIVQILSIVTPHLIGNNSQRGRSNPLAPTMGRACGPQYVTLHDRQDWSAALSPALSNTPPVFLAHSLNVQRQGRRGRQGARPTSEFAVELCYQGAADYEPSRHMSSQRDSDSLCNRLCYRVSHSRLSRLRRRRLSSASSNPCPKETLDIPTYAEMSSRV